MQHKYSNKLGLYYLFTLLCYNTASARLERRNIAIAFPRQYPDSGSLDYPQNEDYPKLFVNEDVLTVVISGTNPAVAGLTNAVTVTIGAKTGSTTANPTTDPIKGPVSSTCIDLHCYINPSPTDSQPTSLSQTNPPSSTTSSSSPSTGSISDAGNGNFLVEGNSSFDKKENALTRSCSVQHNNCANAANAAHNNAFTVNDCDAQQSQCNAVAGSPS
ncbi:hypothetical protein BDP27DRAFT_1331773 [Rhodocollybia butyracea]|uniref:Uncharacterized protein n=1 Tax=Rhodocollybia butyracea TaxID=206335 RepID=A0A9P5PN78_9AGAR|nr:hypothetical protein BDP27DRAFT_1331773 [Rhodocollybia butyracea]